MASDELPHEERVDALFAVPPDEFVGARDALARDLRKAGAREEAVRVGALRRPTLAAWAVNQAVRSEQEALADLLRAGRRLRDEVRRAVSGVRGHDLNRVSQERRTQIDRLTAAAGAHLREAGHDPSGHREPITATFDAASAREETGELVARGRLTRPLERPSQFGELSPLALVGEDAEVDASGAAADVEDDAGARDEGESLPADEEARKEAARREDARRALDALRRRAEAASSEAVQARDAAEDARRAAESAEDEAAAAHERLERARRERDQARRRADEAQRRSERLDRKAQDAETTAERRATDLAEARGQRPIV